MKKVTLSIATVALVGLYAGTASAQCDFLSGPARGVKGSMVRNFAKCPGTEHAVNEVTEGNTPACSPVTPPTIDGVGTTYKYSAKGKCTVTTSAKLLKDCSEVEKQDGTLLGLQANACHITYVTSKCSGIVNSNNELITADDDVRPWTLSTLSRASLNDATGGDMTVIDFPVQFDYTIPDGGKIEVDSTSAEGIIGIVGATNADLPPCTQIEVVNVVIKDPAGLPFAKLGGATKPKE